MPSPSALARALLLALPWGSAPALAQVPSVLTYAGMCEASGAVALPPGSLDGRILVANDEDNRLRAYAAGGGTPLGAGLDLDDHLAVPARDRGRSRGKADLEAATWLGDRIYWVGSHSRNAEGEVRPNRHAFLATRARAGAGGAVLQEPMGQAASLLEALRRVDLGQGLRLGATIGTAAAAPGLAAEAGGLNIEGLAPGPDGTSLLIGLRNPVPRGRAVLVPLLNPAEVVDDGAAPRLGPALMLDLGGRGIRDLTRLAGGGYLILAGPPSDTAPARAGFDLLAWDGPGDGAPRPVPGAAAAFRALERFHPEAVLATADGREALVLSDDGDLARDRGTDCEALPEDRRGFRGLRLALPPG